MLGEVNGIQCQIIPDTGAEITIVPGHLVLASQLLEEYETIRGVAGGPVKAQCARVPIRFEGRQYVSRVVVANRDLLNDNVLFAVPLKGSTARQLFLDAALEADTSGAGQSGDAPDVQGGADTEVNSPSLTREAETCPSGGEQQCQVVTRAAAKKVKAANHREQERARQQVKLSSFEETEPRPGVSQPGAVDELQGSVPPEMGGAAALQVSLGEQMCCRAVSLQRWEGLLAATLQAPDRVQGQPYLSPEVWQVRPHLLVQVW